MFQLKLLMRTVIADLLEKHHICFFGNGAEKCKELITHSNAHFMDELNPSAGAMVKPVLNKFIRL